MLVICSYRDLTVDLVYRYLLLKGLSFVGRISNYPARRGFFLESFESLVSRVVGLSYTPRFSRGVKDGIRKDYLFSQMVYESLQGWSSGQRGEASPYKYLLSTPPPGRDLSNIIRCLTLKITNRSRGPVDPAFLLLITLCRVFSAGGAGE